MQIKEIIEKERSRSGIAEKRKILLFREGSFLRAYEWSAWLCCKFAGELKVTKRQIKGIDEPVAYIGFPPTSIEKFTPQGASIEPQSDGNMVLTLSEESLAEADLQTLTAEYEQWKNELPLIENGKKNRAFAEDSKFDLPFAQPTSVSFLLHRILSYPVELRSPVDNLQFISELKQMATLLV